MIFFLLFVLLFFSSCASHVPTMAELKQTMKKADYDKTLISKFEKFKSIADVLNQNFDTTIKLSERRDPTFDSSFVGTHCSFYTYNSVAQYTNIKDLPNFVYQQVDSIWKEIGEDNILKVEICSNKKITITAKFIKMPNNTAIQHIFIWNKRPDDGDYIFKLKKDTILNETCIYRVGVAQDYSGW